MAFRATGTPNEYAMTSTLRPVYKRTATINPRIFNYNFLPKLLPY